LIAAGCGCTRAALIAELQRPTFMNAIASGHVSPASKEEFSEGLTAAKIRDLEIRQQLQAIERMKHALSARCPEARAQRVACRAFYFGALLAGRQQAGSGIGPVAQARRVPFPGYVARRVCCGLA
jgi:hypothetical protein